MARALRLHEIDNTEYKRLGLIASALGHVFIFVLVFSQFSSGWGDFQKPIVYSVTIEGGKKLGGISQVPDEKKKTMITPPKNTSSQEKKEEKAEKPPEIKKEDKEKLPVADKGEVQIKKKEAKEDKKAKDTKPKKDDKPKTEKYEDVMQHYLGESAAAGGTSWGAGALGGKGMGGGTQMSPEQLAYRDKVQELVHQNFFWIDRNSPLKCDITFTIGTDGRITDATITAGSGDRSYDSQALEAVLKASPLPPPSASFYSRLNPFVMNIRAQDF